MNINVVILAAGKGTRMYSDQPKVLHALAGRPLVEHVIETAESLEPERIRVVVGYGADAVMEAVSHRDTLGFVMQHEQKGTAHAVQQTLDELDETAVALVLYGDVPLIKPENLQSLVDLAADDAMAVLTCDVSDPSGLGRIVRDGNGDITAIVEDKDASEEQKAIREINTGIMAIPAAKLREWLPRIGSNNAQGEYYLTDVIPLALESGCRVLSRKCESEIEAAGVNNKLQLASVERRYQQIQAERLMLAGVGMADPARFDLRGKASVAAGVFIDVNVILEESVVIEEGVEIGPNCVLRDCVVKKGSRILANSVIEESVIGAGCSIGPFARIRPGTELEQNVRIGNFVEVKKAHIAPGSKVNHLSYIGDSELGEEVNVGAGTITCNYDGANKHRTIIGNRVFIGSNSAIVAPVTIADGATIGAGTTVTQDVARDQLAVGRARQNNIDGWQRPKKK